MSAQLILAWLLLGAAAGWLVRLANVRLAATEELTPGRERWQVYGPPVLTALLFGLFAWRMGPNWQMLLVGSLWLVVLVEVIFFDLEHRLILDLVLLPAAIAALILAAALPPHAWLNHLVAGLGAGVLFLIVALLGTVLMGEEAMGFGDVKLVAVMGLMLGLWNGRFSPILSALFVGVLLGGLGAGAVFLIRRKARQGIPYGPFLAVGAIVILFLSRPQ